VVYNPLEDQVLVMTSGNPVFTIYQAGDFLPLIPGDANWDDTVGPADALVLANHWGEGDDAYWIEGDFNGDGEVGPADASIMAAHWGHSLGSAEGKYSPTPVPEPSLVVFLAAAFVMLASRRR
jgi:hypothetical protein